MIEEEKDERKQEEEKEEMKEEEKEPKKELEEKKEDDQQISIVTSDVPEKEQVVVQTLVSLSHASPSVSPTRLRKHTLVYMPNTSSQGDVDDFQEEIDLDEVIEIPKFNLDKLTLEKM